VAVVEVHAVPFLAASYLLTGRFDPNHELQQRPSETAAVLEEQLANAKQDGDRARRRELQQQLQDERENQLGSEQEWRQYRARFDEVLHTAIADGIVADRRELREVFRQLAAHGHVYLDEGGQPWLEVTEGEPVRRVGLTAQSIFTRDSDMELAMRLLLARTNALLAVNAKHRELWPDFEAEWLLLRRAEQTALAAPAGSVIAASASQQ